MTTTSFVDLETRLFAADPSTVSLRSHHFVAAVRYRAPRPASLKPLPFIPRPPEWQRFTNGIGCEAVLLRGRMPITQTAVPVAA